jgi:hypothetical protein
MGGGMNGSGMNGSGMNGSGMNGSGMGGTIMTNMDSSLLQGGESSEITPLKGGGATRVIGEIVSSDPGRGITLENSVLRSEPLYSAKVIDEPMNIVIAQVVSKPPRKGKSLQNKVLKSDRLHAAKVVEVMPENIPWMHGGGEPIQVKEIHLPPDAKVSFSSTTLDEMVQTEYDALLDMYIQDLLPKWNREKGAARVIATDSCSIPSTGTLDQAGVAGFDRLSYILPVTTQKIVLVSPVNGDLENLLHLMTYIEKHTNEIDTVFIFAPLFFDILKDNKRLFTAYLKVRALARATMIILCMNTMPNRIIGCKLGKKQVVTMLEPTYVVYPFERKIGDINVDGLIFSGAAANEVDVPDTKGKTASTSSFMAVPDNNGWVAFPPDIANRDDNLQGYKVYRFTGDKAYPMRSGIVEFILTEDTSSDTATADDTKLVLDKGAFTASHRSELMLNHVEFERVPLDGAIYSIRKPGLVPVTKDWIDLKFTDHEVAMLNALNLRPDMLQEIFGGGWNRELASFMDNMVTSKCFLEPTLLMDANCDTSTTFINKVFQYFLENDLEYNVIKNEKKELVVAQAKAAAVDTVIEAAKEKSDAVKKINKVKSELEDHEARSDVIGLDTGRPIQELLSNPFDDKRIKVLARGTFRPHVTYVKMDDSWAREIMVIELKSNNFARAELSIPGGNYNEEAAKEKLTKAFNKLVADYPGWKFLS